MGKTRQRRYFDREFKDEAVRMVNEQGMKVSQVAHDLGIHPNMLSRWKHEHLADKKNSFPAKEHMKHHNDELRRLRREAAHLRQERDILKKAITILSKHGEKIPTL